MGLLAPRPRQHGMLHPKLRLAAQEKSNKKRKRSNAFSSATPVFLFKIVSALRGAHNGSGPATAGAWGRHQPPYPKISALFSKRNRFCFIKQLPPGFMPERASRGMQHPMLPGAWGEQPHKPKPPHPKISTLFSKNLLHKILCPQGHHLGCNIPCCRGCGASSPTK